MLTHGAEHHGGRAVPAIRVGVGGHRPRRTSSASLIRPADHARGLKLTLAPLTHQNVQYRFHALSRRGRGRSNRRRT